MGNGVVLVETTGRGSLDLYAQRLAERLDVPRLRTDIYHRTAETWNAPLLSRRAGRMAADDVAFLRRLRALGRPVHLPNHHLGRYGALLRAPYVITVHDLIRWLDWRAPGCEPLIHCPNLRDRLYLALDVAGIRRASAVIAVSHRTKRDLVTHLGLPPERVDVVHEGIDHERFRPVPRRLLEDPYVLFVGSEHPRKNLRTLLRAFALLRREPRWRRLRLVKVGAAGGPEARFRESTLAVLRELRLQEAVVLAERVTHDDLVAWYSGAACLALPSRYEGFGLPVVEAMACGCPVVVSGAGSLPEVAGEAGVVVPNPDDAAGLAAALEALLAEDRRRERLRRAGLERARSFSWDTAARRTLEVYRRLAAVRAR